jgi:Zn-dependent protease with chaperone function
MHIDQFTAMVSRLERESAETPRLYRAKVALLALLGFAILGLLLGLAGAGLLLLAGVAAVVAFSGGTALLLLLKLGKLLLLLAIPLWYLVKASFTALAVRLPVPQGREITRREAPALFDAMDAMRQRMRGPRFHHVLIVDDVNAAVVQRPAFGLVGWPRNYLLLGLPLLESMPPQEALAVVAHEYGHLAGSHGRFSAFIYRLRHTWGTVQDHAGQVQGWLGRLVAPLVRWYAPYFNAYTFVLARADEYQADAASAELVGAGHAAHALKRVNLVAPLHQRFMARTFDRIAHEPAPPADLMQRWAEHAGEAPAVDDAPRWLAEALDRPGEVTDTHPTLRSRLQALQASPVALAEAPAALPPPLVGDSAAAVWLGALLAPLRQELQSRWREAVSEPWAERHADVQARRRRLAELRAAPQRSVDEDIERLRLMLQLEPDSDVMDQMAAFNAGHPDHAFGLFLEGAARVDRDDATGLALLDRAMALDPEATKAACERAHAHLRRQGDAEAAERYAQRWRQRDALETLRAQQLQHIGPAERLLPDGLDDATRARLRAQLAAHAHPRVAAVYLARREIPADPTAVQFVMGFQLTWWGRYRRRQAEVVRHHAALDWPVPLIFVTLDGRLKPLRKTLRALPAARIAGG